MAKLRWYFAPCTLGLEAVLADEIRVVGGTSIREDRGGVSFQGDHRVGYAVCLWSRVAVRVLEELVRGRVRSEDDLYGVVQRVSWSRLIRPGQTFGIYAAGRSQAVRNLQFATLRAKDAIVDQLRDETGDRPDVDRTTPDVPLKLVVRGHVATLFRDLAGQSLHRRGWRPIQHKSPLNEAIAAGLLLLSDWDRSSPLCDPMCGSATLLIEAAHLAGDRAPGLRRAFAFEGWSDTDAAVWKSLRAEAESRWKAGRGRIPRLMGNDRHEGALGIARDCVKRAEVRAELHRGDVARYRPPEAPSFVVCNPPWGLRLSEGEAEAWSALGTFLKAECAGASAWVLSGNAELTRHLRLKADRRIPVRVGPIDCRWIHYSLRA